jgi:hypothetical protein
MPYAELEIGLHRRDAGGYAVDLRFSRPGDDAEVRLLRDGPGAVRFDPARLRELAGDPAEYGAALTAGLFADPALAAAFAQARASAAQLGAPLRLRLLIGPTAPELYSLHWETLRDPQDPAAALASEQLPFSRYLSSADWRPVRLRPRGELRALALVASPADLASYGLAPIDVAGELARARAGLGAIPLTAIASGGAEGAAPGPTLERLAAALRDGYDILYLVCHGALADGEPAIWLEDEAGAAAHVSGADLAARLRDLQERPRLAVLASCESAGPGEGALAALGPRLAEAGIPAVLAMQGRVSMQTLAALMPVFFRELLRDGQIDRALSVARCAVRERLDHWMPVLFMRLRSGRIWYVPGFGEDGQSFEKWPALLASIRRGQCTPIVGAHVNASLLGTTQEIAQSWAETYHFPLAPHEREDLPQVAQYLAVNQDAEFPREELVEYLRREILRRHGAALPAALRDAPLFELYAALAARWRAQNPADPYAVLAALPCPIYVTTSLNNLLAEALRAAGKDPQVELCRWHDDLEGLPSIYDAEPDYRPSVQRPLVYHLFGLGDHPDSVVLTEDDYFDYLIRVSTNKDLIPIAVRQALADTALLFLGMRLDDWNFRVLFRSLMQQEGRQRRRRYAHIAGQVLPEEGRVLEPERARRYLESYFQGANISIFWGSAEDFARELHARWAADAQKAEARP